MKNTLMEGVVYLYKHDTYDRRIQLGASRHRWKDAEALQRAGRWSGAMYLAGYAIECSLKAWVCSHEKRLNFKDTKMFRQLGQGAALHNLNLFLDYLGPLYAIVKNRPDGKYANAWHIITYMWQKDKLRYWDKLGNRDDCKRFLEAVKFMYQFILHSQGE